MVFQSISLQNNEDQASDLATGVLENKILQKW